MENFNEQVTQNIGVLVAVISVIAVAGLGIAVANLRLTSSLTRRFGWISGTTDNGGVDSLSTLLESVESNARGVAELRDRLDDTVREGRTHLKWVGLVRYDAFDGVAGQQSYSMCVLDDHHSGVLITSLVGNNFSRGYAVEIKSGEATRKLGDEEKNALAMAKGAEAKSSAPATVPS